MSTMKGSAIIDTMTHAGIMALRRVLSDTQLKEQLATACPIAILVDPALHDPLATHPDTRSLPRLHSVVRGIEQSRRPYLLLLADSEINERALNASVRVATEERAGVHDGTDGAPRSVCAWLVPPRHQSANWKRTLAALNRRATLMARPPGRSERKVFRFWDPRVSVHLHATLGTAAWTECLQDLGVNQWWCLNDDPQSDDALACAGIVDNPLADINDSPPCGWRLDDAQWRELQRLNWTNRILHAATSWDLVRPTERKQAIDIARRALDHGLSDERDVLRFANLALTTHLQFDDHVDVRRMLKTWHEAGAQPGAFASLTQQWSEEFAVLLEHGQWLAAERANGTQQSRI